MDIKQIAAINLRRSQIAVIGTTTDDGAGAGNSFIDTTLIGVGAGSFISMLAILYPGQPASVDSMAITGFDNDTGEVTLAGAYKGVALAIPAGVPYMIVTFRFVAADVAALAAAVAIIDGFHDIPGVDVVTNAQMRDVIGGKADTAIYSGAFNVSSIIRYLKGLMDATITAWGTADAGSDADTLVDAARTEANNYWNGMTLLMITGANAGLDRRIYDYAVGSIEVRDAFPNAIVATDIYVILSDYEALIAAVDSAENFLVRDVIGGKADTAIAVADDVSSVIRYLKGIIAAVGSVSVGKSQIFEKSITSAANVGDVVVATITDQHCLIESIVLHADTVQTGDLTSAGIFGGAAKVITFIAAADALQADLDAIDKQVYWEGSVRLAATKTIVISLVGTGVTPVDLTITIKYRACVSGGYLA